MVKESNLIDQQPKLVWPYLAWTFAITWSAWGLKVFLVESQLLDAGGLIALLLHKIGNFGPSIAAVLVLKKPFKETMRFIFSRGRQGGWLYLLILMGLLTLTVGLAASGQLNAEVNPFFQLLVFLSASFLAAGLGEEVGWRGVLQPTLEKRFSFPLATLLTGLIWASWHLPLMVTSISSFPRFVLEGILYSFCLAGLYKKTRSVLYCIIFHGFINGGAGDFFTFEGRNQAILLLGYTIMAIYGAYLWYQTDREEKMEIAD